MPSEEKRIALMKMRERLQAELDDLRRDYEDTKINSRVAIDPEIRNILRRKAEHQESNLGELEVRIRQIDESLAFGPTEDKVESQWSQMPRPLDAPSIDEVVAVEGHFVASGYRYVSIEGENLHRLHREVDAQATLLLKQERTEIYVDKFAVTCNQFVAFLDSLLARGLARIEDGRLRRCVDVHGRLLAIDAGDYWAQLKDMPTRPWGILLKNDGCQPLPDSSELPVTHISWRGAALYGAWVHNESFDDEANLGRFLLDTTQWTMCATYNPSTRRHQRYPWGETWDLRVVNCLEYWVHNSGHYLDGPSWKDLGIASYSHPLPAADLLQVSPIGCVQMLGNTWEWCSDADPKQRNRRLIKGGACNARKEWCDPKHTASWHAEGANPYIGFRCGFSLRS